MIKKKKKTLQQGTYVQIRGSVTPQNETFIYRKINQSKFHWFLQYFTLVFVKHIMIVGKDAALTRAWHVGSTHVVTNYG